MDSGKKMIIMSLKSIGKVLAVLLTGIISGFLILCFVHLLPVERMHKNVLASKDILNSHAQIIPGYLSTEVDNYTDSIMLNEAICPIDAPITDKVVNNYQVNYFRGYSQQENLLRYLNGEAGYDYQGYSHYWGGHQVFLKLLLLLFDYADILVINLFLQAMLMALIIAGLCRAGRQYFVVPFCIAVLSMMPMTISLCLQFCDVFYIALLGSAVIIWKSECIESKRMYFLFLLLGMMTSYFDFLTYPFVSLGFPLVTGLVFLDDKGTLSQVYAVIKNSMAWCIGYAGQWIGKWVLGSILSPQSGSMTEAISSIRYRGSNVAQGITINTFDVLLKNMFVYLRWPVILMVGMAVCVFMMVSIRRKKTKAANIQRCIPYIVVSMYPIVWYTITKNHSYEHSFMAYRELAISTLAGLGMLSQLAYGRNGAEKGNMDEMLQQESKQEVRTK